MAALASVTSAVPSSQFAVLLRRSKFASFDPNIGQVYTSFGGDARRGNWGLKRPLPIRRRQAHITVGAVDTKEQQTEWEHAGQEARFVKMWDEVGIQPTVLKGPWAIKLGPLQDMKWVVDSEFHQKEKGKEEWRQSDTGSLTYGPQSSTVPNIDAMSDKEFERYLNRLRKMRPAFRDFLKEASDRDQARESKDASKKQAFEFKSLWALSRGPNVYHKKFLGRLAYDHYNSPDSPAIEQQPAHGAGLSYASASLLQSLLYTRPYKGRLLEVSPTSGEGLVAYAGMSSFLPSAFLDRDKKPINWKALADHERARPRSNGLFRYISAQLEVAPNVVGAVPQGVEGMRLTTSVMDVTSQSATHGRSNPYLPGSPEYIAFTPSLVPTQKPSIITLGVRSAQKQKQQKKAEQVAAADMLKMLGKMR